MSIIILMDLSGSAASQQGSTALVNQTGLELRSLVKSDGALELSLVRLPVPTPKDNEVVVRIEATPINPSDLGLLLSAADLSVAKTSGKGAETVVMAPIGPAA